MHTNYSTKAGYIREPKLFTHYTPHTRADISSFQRLGNSVYIEGKKHFQFSTRDFPLVADQQGRRVNVKREKSFLKAPDDVSSVAAPSTATRFHENQVYTIHYVRYVL